MSETEAIETMGTPATMYLNPVGTGRQLIFYPKKGTCDDGIVCIQLNTHEGFVHVISYTKVNRFENRQIRRLLKLNSASCKWRKATRPELQVIAARIGRLGGLLDHAYIGRRGNGFATVSHSKSDGRYVFLLTSGGMAKQSLWELGLAQ